MIAVKIINRLIEGWYYIAKEPLDSFLNQSGSFFFNKTDMQKYLTEKSERVKMRHPAISDRDFAGKAAHLSCTSETAGHIPCGPPGSYTERQYDKFCKTAG